MVEPIPPEELRKVKRKEPAVKPRPTGEAVTIEPIEPIPAPPKPAIEYAHRPVEIPTCPAGTRLAWSSARGYYCATEAEMEIEPEEFAPLVKPLPITPPLLERLYPEMFEPEATWGFTREEIPAQVEQALRGQAEEYPEEFIRDLYARTSEEEAEEFLRELGASEEFVESVQLFRVGEERQQEALRRALPRFEPEETIELATTDWDAFIEEMRLGGRTKDKQDLLRMMGFEWEDINEIFKTQKVVIEIEGIRRLVTILDNNIVLDEKGREIGTYNAMSGEYTPYEYRLGDTWLHFSAGVGDVIATSGGALKWMGADEIGERLSEFGQFLQLQAPPDTLGDFNWQHLYNPRWYATRFTRTLPFTLTLVPAMIAGAHASLAIVPTTLGPFARTIIGALGATALSRPLESAFEAGGAYDEALNKGLSEQEAGEVANEVFFNNLKLAGLDVGQLITAFAPSPFKSITSLTRTRLFKTAMVGGRLTITGLTEAGEEYYQEIIQKRALGEEIKWDAEMKEVVAIGGIMGLGLGSAGVVWTSIKDKVKNNLSPELQTIFDGQPTDLDGFNAIAETPEGKTLIENVVENEKINEIEGEIKPKDEADRIVWEHTIERMREEAPTIEKIPEVVPEVKLEITLKNTIIKNAKDIFGYTANPREAGYITEDGRMMDFSGKREDGTPGMRSLDHRDIGRAYPEDFELAEGENWLTDFERRSNAIRYHETKDSVIFSVTADQQITDAQVTKLRRLVVGKKAYFDFYNADGTTRFEDSYEPVMTSQNFNDLLGRIHKQQLPKPPVVEEVRPPPTAWEMTVKERFDKIDSLEKEMKGVQSKQAELMGKIDELRKIKPKTEAHRNEIARLNKELNEAQDRIVAIADEITELKTPTKPPVVPEVIEEAPERIVYTEKGIPVPPEETIPQSVADNIPILQDIGAKERIARPTRKTFERMDLYVTYKGIQRAEVLVGEEQVAFIKEVKDVVKTVGKNKERWGLIFDEANEKGSVVGLTFNEKRAVNFIRNWANEWADKKNLPQEKRIKDYIPHLFEQEMIDQLKETGKIPAEMASILSEKVPKKITDPFLKKRLGAVGFLKDPFHAMVVYNKVASRILHYEPFLQKIATIANDPKQSETVRRYLKDYSRRMTGEPSKIDLDINKDVLELAKKIRGLPGGEAVANFLSRGNPSGLAAYQFTGVIYTLWLGFKGTSAIRNLSQHTLIIGEVGPVHFADGIRMRFTKEGKQALLESLVLRSRKAAFVPGIDDSFAEQWTDEFREVALYMFRLADKQNVSDAFLAGYSEAKKLLPNADRQVWIDRGDEVAADTQYLYTKMNSMPISQSAPGRVFSILTTWMENWMELMAKWIARRPSQVYLQHERATGEKVAGANWATSYKAILMYMLIVGLGYAIKERTRLKAWEYTGITSIRYLAGILGGDFPGLQAPGAIGKLVGGFVTDDERMFKEGWNQFKRTLTPGILKQLTSVAEGDKDWLTLLLYLEGRDWKIKQLKDGWEKEFEAYPLFKDKEGEYDINLKLEWMRKHPKQAAWSESKIRSQWRIDNPLTEAKMFIVSQFTTLSSDKARAEVLRLIEKHDINTEFIDGYEKVFGIDTDEELTKFKKRIGMLEKFVVGEEAEYFTVSSFVTEVNRLVKTQGRTKVDRDGSPFTLEILRAQDSFVQYDSLEETDARTLFRQQFPDIEALLYLTGRIQSFQNPKSAEILLGLMKKYDIPPEGIRAFVEDPARYDELFTQKFELEQKWVDQSTEYENYGNPESPLFIEDKEERAKVRDEFKENNPNWIADMRRVEAIDHDATEEIIEKWAERGKTTDKFGAGSSEAKVWLIDNPETFKWALDQKLLTDDGSDWNEDVLRLNVEMAKLDEESAEYAILKRKREAHTSGFADFVDDYVSYYDLPVAGYRQERYLSEHPEFAQAMANIKGIEIPTQVPPLEYDELLEKVDRTRQEDLKLDAYKKFVPNAEIENYVAYYSLKKPERLELWYEDDWFLMEHMNFYREVYLKIQGNERADFRQVPSREVYKKYQVYLTIPKGKPRDDYRYDNRDLDKWLVLKFDYVPIAEKKIREKLTPAERRALETAERLEEMREKLKELTE